MAEKPVGRLPQGEPRHCPQCGTRVAARARTCLMCGADLTQEAHVEHAQPTAVERKPLPGWVRALAVIGLALVILVIVGYGFLRLAASRQPPPTPTTLPTRTPTVTPTPTPSATPTPSPTPTPLPPRSHQVQPGETLSEIAQSYGVGVEEIEALNPELEPELLQPGRVILIPPEQALVAEGAADAPTAAAGGFVIHIVQPGEALLSIAEKYDVSVEAIRLANNLSLYEDTIQVNQSLVIPLGTPTPTPLPTPDANATPTPLLPYAAPALLYPPDGAVLEGGDDPVVLHWAAVAILKPDEWYQVSLYPPPSGVLSSTHTTRATSWHVPSDLLRVRNGIEQEFRWQVQVVRAAGATGGTPAYVSAGVASPVHTFTWRAPTATPTPGAP